ncbi:MAG: alpha/beta fold hydrolase [Pseudomonadales bacterium]
MTEPRRLTVDANGVRLNLYALGEESENPPVIMLHGMRDVALSLMPVAERLTGAHPVYLPDLRGHGASDKPGGYSMAQLVYDLHAVIEALGRTPVVLFGHSLGGHVVCRFAALFPERVSAAVVVEGLGPPEGRRPSDPAQALAAEGARLLATLGAPHVPRPLPSFAFAAERLLVNNPRLAPERALELARLGTYTGSDGALHWAFDPRVQSVFVGADTDANERYWSAVRCPTCVIAGAFAGEYWRSAVPAGSDWTGEFAPGELEARVALFPDAELTTLPGSGHMVHFDEPEALAGATLDFLRRRL